MAAVIRSRITLPALKPTNTGTSREDLGVLDEVILEAADTSNTTYAWTLAYKPEGSAAVLSGDPTAANPGQFVVDLEGPYLVRLITDLGLPTENQQFVRLRYLTELGELHLPAGGEQLNSTIPVPVDIDPQGWADDQNRNIQTLLGFIQTIVASGNVLYVDPATTHGDHSTIQEAIDAAVTAGASSTDHWVVLPRPGTYVEDVTFAAFVHVIGWPGNSPGTADMDTVVIRSATAAQHEASTPSGVDQIILGNLTLENLLTSSGGMLDKTGSGNLTVFRCHLAQQGTDGSQGPAFLLSGGTATLDECTLLMSPAAPASRAAFWQDTASTTSTLHRCHLVGPSGMRLNESLAASVSCDMRDCRIVSSGGAGAAAILTDAETLTIEYSRVESAVADTIQVHPGAASYAGDVALTMRWSYVSGNIDFDTTGPLSGTSDLNLGSCEYLALSFPGGSPTNFRATTKARTLFYDNTLTVADISADNVQEAIDQVYAFAAGVRTLDDAYDGGVPLSGSGRAILADQGAVQVLDAASPSDPPPAANTDGVIQAVGGVEVGSISKPEIDLDPNPYGSGAIIRMGWSVVPPNTPFGNAGDVWVLGNSTGTALFRNYNLRTGTKSSEGGGKIGRLILRGGDALPGGGSTPDAASVYLHAGSGFDGAAGDAGDVFVAPGDSIFGPAGAIFMVRPEDATAATLTAAGAFVGSVTGTVRFGTNMGAIEVAIDAADGLAAVLVKLAASLQVTAVDSGGGVIRLTSLAKGPNAAVYFLNADTGLDAALGVFDGQVQVDGTWPSFIRFQVTAANEVTIGGGGATGPMIYNSDTGKLTIPGIIDPIGVIFDENAPLTAPSNKGVVFVGDGSGGTVIGHLYYVHESGALQDITAAVLGIVKVEREEFAASTFAFGTVSTHALGATPNVTNADIVGIFELFRSGVADMTLVTSPPTTNLEYSINGTDLEIGTDIRGSGILYRIVYPKT